MIRSILFGLAFACLAPLVGFSQDSIQEVEATRIDSLADSTLIQQIAPSDTLHNPMTTIDSLRLAVLKRAQSQLGTPYRYGAMAPGKAFDCSGFICHVFDSIGITPPRRSADYVHLTERPIADSIMPGDVLVFTGRNRHASRPGHVGLVSAIKEGVIYFFHASSSRGVVESSLSTSYFRDRFLFAVRFLTKGKENVIAP